MLCGWDLDVPWDICVMIHIYPCWAGVETEAQTRWRRLSGVPCYSVLGPEPSSRRIPRSVPSTLRKQSQPPFHILEVWVTSLYCVPTPAPRGQRKLASPVRNAVQALGQVIPALGTLCPAWEELCHLHTGVVTQLLARVATGSLTPDLPPTGSKNPKIALKLAELQTDEQGKASAGHVLGALAGAGGSSGGWGHVDSQPALCDVWSAKWPHLYAVVTTAQNTVGRIAGVPVLRSHAEHGHVLGPSLSLPPLHCSLRGAE